MSTFCECVHERGEKRADANIFIQSPHANKQIPDMRAAFMGFYMASILFICSNAKRGDIATE